VIGGDGLPALDKEQGKEGSGPSPRQLERATFMVERLDWPEDPKLQVPLRDSGVQVP
jgi:hypothetical protein